jgi:tRNA G18 (ribose-2'-O)-methylase SpoU
MAETGRRDCLVGKIYVSRHTDAALIECLQRRVRKEIPIIELSTADLALAAGQRRHDGVVAVIGEPPRRTPLAQRGLSTFARLAVAESAQRP